MIFVRDELFVFLTFSGPRWQHFEMRGIEIQQNGAWKSGASDTRLEQLETLQIS